MKNRVTVTLPFVRTKINLEKPVKFSLMKKQLIYYLALIVLQFPLHLQAQIGEVGTISYKDFPDLKINNAPVFNIIFKGESWNQVKSIIGNINPICTTGSDNTSCTFNTTGIQLTYTDHSGDLELYKAIFTSDQYLFDYNGHTFKVGDPISAVAQAFPSAYNSKGQRQHRNETWHSAILQVVPVDTVLQIYYDPSTLKITKIDIWKSTM